MQGLDKQEGYEEAVGSFWEPLLQLPEDTWALRVMPATLEEVREASDVMNQSAAPGPDGLVAGFYSTFFDVVGGFLLKLVNSFLERVAKPPSFSAGRVVLIPREGMTSSSHSPWRPITLLNTAYKLLATLLVRRLRVYLRDLGSPYQSSSVPARSVYAHVLLRRDVFGYACHKQVNGAFVALDQAKAFVSVEHSCLFVMLRCFGLPQDFIDPVRSLYAGITSEFVVNGTITETLPVMRGVRQGCPLSPTLFALWLNPLLRSVASHPRILGFTVTGQENHGFRLCG